MAVAFWIVLWILILESMFIASLVYYRKCGDKVYLDEAIYAKMVLGVLSGILTGIIYSASRDWKATWEALGVFLIAVLVMVAVVAFFILNIKIAEWITHKKKVERKKK